MFHWEVLRSSNCWWLKIEVFRLSYSPDILKFVWNLDNRTFKHHRTKYATSLSIIIIFNWQIFSWSIINETYLRFSMTLHWWPMDEDDDNKFPLWNYFVSRLIKLIVFSNGTHYTLTYMISSLYILLFPHHKLRYDSNFIWILFHHLIATLWIWSTWSLNITPSLFLHVEQRNKKFRAFSTMILGFKLDKKCMTTLNNEHMALFPTFGSDPKSYDEYNC